MVLFSHGFARATAHAPACCGASSIARDCSMGGDELFISMSTVSIAREAYSSSSSTFPGRLQSLDVPP